MPLTHKELKKYADDLSTHLRLFSLLLPALKATYDSDGGYPSVHGPHFVAPFMPLTTEEQVEDTNKAFLKRQRRAKRLLAEGKFRDYVYCVERPYRLDAFKKIRSRLTDQRYWKLLSDIWTDTEHPSRWPDITKSYIRLFESKRKYRPLLMNREERRVLASLPDEMTIYRGGTTSFGLSWTLDRERAEFFVRHNADFWEEDGQVFTGTVAKRFVYAYLDGRKEKEIVVNPRRVKLIT